MSYSALMVGTDGSDTAVRAVEAATRLAKRLGARLHIVTAFGGEVDQQTAIEVVRYAREAVRRDGVETKTHLLEGAPEEAIVELAKRHGVDVIVVGNVGMGRASRFRLGGIAERIAHAAPCDVLIVHTKDGGSTAAGDYHKLLVGTDGSATASEAARKGFQLAELIGATVKLVHVGDPLIGAVVLERTAKDRAGTAPAETEAVESGDPAERIVEVAGGGDVDLVVVGNKGMAGPRRYLLGSVPSKVAHASPVDVLIAKTVGRTIEDIAPGHGALVDVGGKRVAVYKAEDGTITTLSPKCQHMGCTVDWNDADRSWDCPCHGSRYRADGAVFQGPAKKDLDPEQVG